VTFTFTINSNIQKIYKKFKNYQSLCESTDLVIRTKNKFKKSHETVPLPGGVFSRIQDGAPLKLKQNAQYPISPNEYPSSKFIFDPALAFAGQCSLRWMNSSVMQ
jgi:hypothetical protein